jgi:threonine dehydratase
MCPDAMVYYSPMIPLEQIQQAADKIKGGIIQTPLIHSPALSRRCGGDIYLKLENLQKTGSFKIRGASYKLLKHLHRIGPKGVVAASAGNHAQGVALAAREAGVPATIVMPEWVSITKQEATRVSAARSLSSAAVLKKVWWKPIGWPATA